MDRKKDFLRLVVDRDPCEARIKGVYLVTDQGEQLVERVADALAGGVRIVQYRTKEKDPNNRLAIGLALKNICHSAGVPFIVNDDLELALTLNADGLHLGQEDGDPLAAREALGAKRILGISTHTLEEALRAEASGADYIGFGAMYPTASKDVIHLPGPATMAAIKPRLTIPVVAIGGINQHNAAKVIDSGADAIAVISSVLGSRSPGVTAAALSLLFNRRGNYPRGTVLTVAGSDSSGGAGVQADLKTITLLGAYCASVITALTAQNTRGVNCILGTPPSFVAEQLDAVLSDLQVDVVKTGMLYSAAIITMLVEKLELYQRKIVVVDPVMMAKGGATLIDQDALAVFKKLLLPLTYLLTPNIPEAEKLTGMSINNEEEMQSAARELYQMGAHNVIVKGGHLAEGMAVDILYDGNEFSRFASPRVHTKNTHGTGCTFASAIATCLASGEPLQQAVARAKDYITSAIRLAMPLGKGHGPVNHYKAAEELKSEN